jgi:hypothetical protein
VFEEKVSDELFMELKSEKVLRKITPHLNRCWLH